MIGPPVQLQSLIYKKTDNADPWREVSDGNAIAYL